VTNKFFQAFKESGNVVGLASTVALSAALLNPVPLLVGLVAETAYLLFVPDTPWYRARLARRSELDVVGRRQRVKAETLPKLRPEMRQRYERLEGVRRQIEAQTREQAAWLQDMLRKLEYLLDKFLTFALKEQEFRNYLQSLLVETRGTGARPGLASRVPNTLPSTMPDAWIPQAIGEIQADYSRALSSLQQAISNEVDPNSQAILQKRADVLVRRQEYVGKMGRTLTNLNYQMQLVEDTFGLINDEVRARSPEQVLSDIDDVVTQTDVMARTLEEIAPLDQMIARAG
jgi:hypothetical protein